MKFILQAATAAFISALLQLYFPWWTAVFGGVAAGLLFSSKSVLAFAAGFLGVFAVWFGYSYWLDMENASLLSAKIAALFQLNSPMLLMLIGSLMGGITGGLGAWVGSELRSLVLKK